MRKFFVLMTMMLFVATTGMAQSKKDTDGTSGASSQMNVNQDQQTPPQGEDGEMPEGAKPCCQQGEDGETAQCQEGKQGQPQGENGQQCCQQGQQDGEGQCQKNGESQCQQRPEGCDEGDDENRPEEPKSAKKSKDSDD